jgi:hypothetical protein
MVLPCLPPSLALPLPGDLVMKILLPSQDGDFPEALNQVESWDFVVAPYNLPGKDNCLKQDFWLGSSRNGSTWVLVTVPIECFIRTAYRFRCH